MLEVLTTEDFAAWFSALEGEVAEEVAESIEVIARLGARTEAPESTEWLLWYEHPSVSSRHDLEAFPYLSPAARTRWRSVQNSWGVFLGYVKRVTTHLESPRFVARLDRLGSSKAAAVIAALRRIRAASTARRLALPELMKGPLRAGTDTLVERLVDVTEIREAYFAALSAAGFDVIDVPAHSAALREIALRSRTPGLRLLYGVDARRDQALVVLGEWLDRSFYGDSVRRAEPLWRQFLDGDLAVTPPITVR